MAEVRLTKNAEKDFSKLPKSAQKKVIKKLKALETSPRLGKPLVGDLKGYWSARAWPYRIIYQIHQQLIVVHTIAHRKEVYR